ncbi:MAG: arsenic efflux protein [Kiritimatiellae bacterium]|nr:arsenic efflux protein [Kiritimatiellia bacterium]
MIDFLLDNLLLFPFLFATYLALEAMEARAGGALERLLGRARHWGPVVGAVAGAVPQCGFSAAVASFYAGGMVTAGTLVAVFLSTSDELIPVFLSAHAPMGLLLKIVALKTLAGLAAGLLVNAALRLTGKGPPVPRMDELCAHSRCGCSEHRGIVRPALIHAVEIFVFILVVSGAVELAFHFAGEDALEKLVFNRPFVGEMVAGLVGFIPNCAVSVMEAQLYLKGGMSAGALMAGSLTGSGVGLLVLFRTNRSIRSNLAIMGLVYVFGVLFGWAAGFLL